MKQNDDIDKFAVVYARYSSHGQTEQSIEGQLAAAKTYAEAKGYTIIKEYIDRAMTGRNDNRDEFQKMLSDTASKQFRVIIVWKVDRFGRNREEITFNKYRCKKNGVRVEYVAENLPDSAESVILESVLEGMAEYYSLQLSQNVRRGQYESAKKHKAIGGHVPLGYRADENNEYVIDDKTAPTVRMIYEWYADGSTVAEIIRKLNEMGLRTAKGERFTRNSLNVLLENEKYIGVYTFKDLIRDEDAIPAIVDRDTFYKVQRMLEKNRKAPSRKWSYTDYLLSEKLYCGKCGSSMIGSSGTGKLGVKYNYYVCEKQRRGKTCDKKPVRQEWIEGIVLREIRGILNNDEVMEFITETTWQYYLNQDETQEKLRSLQKQIDAVEKSLSNVMKAIEMGAVSSTMIQRVEELEGQRTALKAAMSDIELKRGFHLTREQLSFFLGQFRDMDFTDRECQRRLVDVFVNAIFLYDDHIKITFNFGGDNGTISLDEADKAEAGEGFACCLPCPTKLRRHV